MNHVSTTPRQQVICTRCDKHYNGTHGTPPGWKIAKLGDAEGLICDDCATPPSRPPVATDRTHKQWTVGPTAYLRNLSLQDVREETFAILYQPAPSVDANGNRSLSMRYPVAIGSFYLDDPRAVLQQIADRLNAGDAVPGAQPSAEMINELAENARTAIRYLDEIWRSEALGKDTSWAMKIATVNFEVTNILAALPSGAA